MVAKGWSFGKYSQINPLMFSGSFAPMKGIGREKEGHLKDLGDDLLVHEFSDVNQRQRVPLVKQISTTIDPMRLRG